MSKFMQKISIFGIVVQVRINTLGKLIDQLSHFRTKFEKAVGGIVKRTSIYYIKGWPKSRIGNLAAEEEEKQKYLSNKSP